jgi:diguanylate cyclase (GGDEF)-like protein
MEPLVTDQRARGGPRTADDGLDEVLRGSFAVDTYNKVVRILGWSFILISLLVALVDQLWQPARPQITAALILAGAFVLAVHELMSPTNLRTARVVIEGSGAIVFLTLLDVLTGYSSSPFFFLFALLVGGAALVAAPRATLILGIETVVANAVVAISGLMDSAVMRDVVDRVAINLLALCLLAYLGTIVARVQHRTRNAAIRLSTVDSLTDLFNRGYFFNAVEHEIQRARRFRRGFCLLLMDLDGLKSINDRYGHYQGDVVIRGVAQLIRGGLRRIDVAARYGGDEFVALLPETDSTGAYVVADKIRQMVSELVVEPSILGIRTSISIGVVSFPDDGQTADELMIAADEAMYSSKSLGKNRVVGYAEPGDLAQAALVSRRKEVIVPGFRPLPRQPDDRQADRRGNRWADRWGDRWGDRQDDQQQDERRPH